MSAADKIALHRRYNDEVLNQGNLDLVDDLFTPDYVDHAHASPEIHGPQGLRQFVSVLANAFPDRRFTVEDRVIDHDRMAVRWTLRGTHEGEFAGIPPTGKQVTVTGISIHHFAGDKIQESWDYYDALGLLQQFGVLPRPGQEV
jgi:steroid delta-isomerase-like uncharacterized protein